MMLNVLVAESSDQAWASIVDGVRRYQPEASILRVKDGEQAIRFLFHRGLFTEVPETPNLVVLAGDLPRVPAEAIVARLRQHPRTCSIPVILVASGERLSDLGRVVDYQQWLGRQESLVAVGTADLQTAVAGAAQRLCDEPPVLVAPPELESRRAIKSH